MISLAVSDQPTMDFSGDGYGGIADGGALLLRFQFPRNPCKARYDRRAAEGDARKVAAYWLEQWHTLPREQRNPGWLEQAIKELAVRCRVEAVEGPELPGGERLAPWLSFVRAPGRVFLQVTPTTMDQE